MAQRVPGQKRHVVFGKKKGMKLGNTILSTLTVLFKAQFFDVMPNLAEHSHLVVVGENDEKSMMGEDVIGLPRPPLIVLRYIIYWPD